MNIHPRLNQNSLLKRTLICFLLPIIAIAAISFEASAAPKNAPLEPIISNSISAQSNITATHLSYLPLIYGVPLPAPTNVKVSRAQPSGGTYSWTLTWDEVSEPTDATYIIVESNSPTMTPVTNSYSSATRSKTISHPASINNVYYYAVRVANISSSLSEPVRVVSAYRDDFNDPNSGWATRRQDFDDTNNVLSYENGTLKMHVRGRWDYFITSPLAEAPPPPYRISTRVKFDGPGNLNTYGIIFGGDNNGGACPTVFPPAKRSIDQSGEETEYDVLPIGVRAPAQSYDIANVDDNCLNYYFRMMFLWKDGFGSMLAELKEVYYHSDNNSGRGVALSGDDFLELLVSSRNANDWNDWSIEVYPNGLVKVFSGADRVYEAVSDKSFLINGTTFGFWASTDEYPGSDPLYEYILVEPIN